MSMVQMTGHGEYGAVILKVFHLHQQSSKKNGFNIKDSEDSPKNYIKDIDKISKYLGRYFDIEYKRGVWLVFLRVKLLPDPVLVRQIQYVHEFQHILWAMGIDAGFDI